MKLNLTFFMFIISGILFTGCTQENQVDQVVEEVIDTTTQLNIETFTFTSNGTQMERKISLPTAYESNKNLPKIYLIDFTEQHFQITKD